MNILTTACFSGSNHFLGEDCLKKAVASDLRDEWPIVSLCLAPGEGTSKHLLLTRIKHGQPPLTASVELSADDTQLLERWRGAMEENRNSLRGHTAEEATAWGNKEKALWWKRRAVVDETVGCLLTEIEERWLSAHGLSAVLLGDIVGREGLNLELRRIYEFARDRLNAARRASAGVTGKRGSRKQEVKGCRGITAAASAEGSADPEVGDGFSNGVSELIHLCVRGGEVMSEEAWVAVVRLALSDVASDGAIADVSHEIHEQVQAVFARGETEGENRFCADSPVSLIYGKGSRWSLDVESGRSVGSPARARKAQTAMAQVKNDTSVTSLPLDEATLSKMRVADLRRELSARNISITGLKLKMELLAKLREAVQDDTEEKAEVEHLGEASHESDDGGTSRGGSGGGLLIERHPVVLVLDETLQAIPWEGLPCLRGRAVTRVPAVPFVFSALASQWGGGADSKAPRKMGRSSKVSATSDHPEEAWVPSRDGIRLTRGFYVLDPEANLPRTGKQLGPFFEGIERRLGWSGVKGKAPTQEAMAQSLQNVDIFAYCGHGAGELLIGREEVAGLTGCAVAVLMGCSSGRLKGYGDFEPTGMVSSYLAGGSPAVVANLWDVTDKDIDRYSEVLFGTFLGGRTKGVQQAFTLAHAVAEARVACKMPYIIGHAPVCYGIPLSVAAS